ncbi:hypothetical protein Sjap_008153 [Stephania japonica]|uniref:Uncharacterized protein n=1 Tax=Stephania japonica TaxID=461633 RepID=A0AAP0PC11_9MAGN
MSSARARTVNATLWLRQVTMILLPVAPKFFNGGAKSSHFSCSSCSIHTSSSTSKNFFSLSCFSRSFTKSSLHDSIAPLVVDEDASSQLFISDLIKHIFNIISHLFEFLQPNSDQLFLHLLFLGILQCGVDAVEGSLKTLGITLHT